MASKTISKPPTSIGNDLAAQTRYLFHRYVHDVTNDTGITGTLHSRAFEEMNNMEPRELFGPDLETFDELVSCLKQHALSIQNDVRLQQVLEKVKQHFTRDRLWDLCKNIFTSVDDVWSAILTIFTFGLELCRLVAVALYETIVDTITEAVMKWASNWLVNNGGWVAVGAGSGVLRGVMNVVTSWASWLTPSFLTSSTTSGAEATSPDGESASASKEGESASASKDGASESASKEGASESASKEGESASASKDGASDSASKEGESASASKEGASESASKEGESASASKDGASESASKEGESASASKEGASKSASKEGASESASKDGVPTSEDGRELEQKEAGDLTDLPQSLNDDEEEEFIVVKTEQLHL